MSTKTVIVTGSGKGIGKCIATFFANEKWNVIVAEIDEERGMKTAEEISINGGKGLFIKTDVSKIDQVCELAKKTKEKFGRIDVLINNAGISEFYDPLEISEENWNRIIDTNLKGMFFLSREVAKVMRDNEGGTIINIASTRAVMSEPDSEAYAASKGGVLALTHAMAASFSKYKITVNAILPGWIETGDYSALKQTDHEQHFSQRVGKPDDIARACMFLANSDNQFITGSQITIDGGMTRKMIYFE